MKLKFKKQQYQEDAAKSVVECFEGQPAGKQRDIVDRRNYVRNEGTIWEEEIDEEVVFFGNKKIELSKEEIRRNIRRVQKQNNLDYTDDQETMNYSIEMETGTGKTYTYIKTMYELNKAYGWSKFIVIVPSIAIREGVLKSFQITEEHFKQLYNKKIRYFVYNSNNSSNIANINNFAEDANIEVMIMNYQAFNTRSKATRRIYEELDELQSRSAIDVLKATNPILIIDEPQKMGKTEDILREFNPLFILRYSATHKEKFRYNMIYRLDALDSYNQKLVKKINVKGIEILHNKSENTYLYLEGVELSKSAPIARMEIEVKSPNGVSKLTRNFKVGDNLYDISKGLEQYRGYKISEIDARHQSYDKVIFTNGEEILTGQIIGDAEETYMSRIQIRETIKSHFEKERELYKKGIKVLSLFFIDEVAKYRIYDEERQAHNGEYAKIFEEEYDKIYEENYESADEEYKEYLDSLKSQKVHNGYFSIDKKASKGLNEDETIFIDSNIDNKDDGTSSDADAYDLIMKDKERLLSLEEPVRFIFSHSALREGWDNPNIFQICTLKKSNSEISKRQEIGRGLRICVNKNGDRMDYSELDDDFFAVNNLTVIASQSYESFAKALQSEILDNLSRKSYEIIDDKLFLDKELIGQNGEILVLDKPTYYEIFTEFLMNGYIDKKGNILQKLREDIVDNNVTVPESLEIYADDYIKLIKDLFTDIRVPIENDNKRNLKILRPNDNFDNEEFQDLWNKISIKTVYEVNFNSEELIARAVNRLDEELKISKMILRKTKGEQRDVMSINLLKSNDAMVARETKNEIYEDFTPVGTKYDLVGTLAKDTGLTRHTIIEILTKIKSEVFEQYKYNPEEFIRKATDYINDEKGITIINGIEYSKIDERYDNEIFTINNAKGKMGENVYKVERNIYDYLITDSKNELEFAKKLEIGEVKVYAKLPRGFKIPTPVGNYNPDWAIVFNKKGNKHIYFIAETKGTMNINELRGVEKAKIMCAKKHFKAICSDSVQYDVVDSYESLVDLAMIP